jgi:tRNA(Ile)-lysidine synthase
VSASGLIALFAPLAEHRVAGLAVSGGPDSLALMLLAHAWAREQASPPKFVVYTVDHGLRSEAAAEAVFVAVEAAKLGLTARVLRWEGDKPATGLQEAARSARYRLIGEAMAHDAATVLLTAHHLDDQAETVLMRLAHGSGIEGLRGMATYSEVEGVPIFRPLLGVERKALVDAVAAAGITPVNDPSNADSHYERVRWRGILPALAALGLDARRLARFAARMGDADEALTAMTDEAVSRAVTAGPSGLIQIDRAQFGAVPRAIAVRLLSRLLAEVGGGHKSRALGTVEALCEKLAADAPFRGKTLHGCIVRRGKGAITIAPEPGRAAKAQIRITREPTNS